MSRPIRAGDEKDAVLKWPACEELMPDDLVHRVVPADVRRAANDVCLPVKQECVVVAAGPFELAEHGSCGREDLEDGGRLKAGSPSGAARAFPPTRLYSGALLPQSDQMIP